MKPYLRLVKLPDKKRIAICLYDGNCDKVIGYLIKNEYAELFNKALVENVYIKEVIE